MSEELIQRGLISSPEKFGSWNYYNIGSTTLKALKNAKIIPDKDYDEYEHKKPDALICKNPVVVAAIEYKQPSELRTKKQIDKAIRQELGTASALKAKIYIITDGTKTIWINPSSGNKIKDEEGNELNVNFDKNSEECVKLVSRIMETIDANNDQLRKTCAVDPLPLAQRVWQDLWAVSGATPENCLYTFVEVFIFKYLSDLGVLRGIYSFSNLLAQYGENDDNEVLEFYASTVRVKIKELFPGNIKDNTTIINGTIFVSKDDKAVSGYASVFKKILLRFENFGTLENIDYDFKSKLFETFLKESISKKNWGQFFTPLKVVRAIVKMADISEGMSICDPACGVGKFLLEPILQDLHRFYKIEGDKLVPKIHLQGFDKGFDKDEQKTIILAKANMLIYMSDLIKEHRDITTEFARLFNETFTLQTNSILGTLAKPYREKYDLILTNPPYVMSGSSNLKDEISKSEELKSYYSINAMGIEGLFMEWIVRALKKGGKAFIVVPDGILNRSNDKKLRDFILQECYVDAIISLPLNTFFTTNKKTYILALTKKEEVFSEGVFTKPKQKTPVFTYLCSEIGESRDIYRFDIEQNDLAIATTLFNMFKGAKNDFETSDPRCKLFDIDTLYNANHWSVDRWWTREEKIAIGVEDQIDSIDLDGYISMINETANAILEFEEPLKELAKKKESINDEAYVSLADESLFELAIGKRVLKKDYINSSGTIPIFSANVFEPFVYSNTSNISDFTKPYVIWGIDGEFEFNVMKEGSVFGTTDHCGSIKIKDSNINPVFLQYALKECKHEYGFDRGLRASLRNMKQIKIKIPVKSNGEFDYEAQASLAKEFECIQQMRAVIKSYRDTIENINVIINNDDFTFGEFKLSDIFELVRGKSKYTKKYGNKHPGEFPVYSASSNDALTFINHYDYEGEYLSWTTNGFAGKISVLSGKFSINGDRAILVLKDSRKDIDLLYTRFMLEPIFRSLAKGRRGDKGEDEFTKLYPSMIKDLTIFYPIKDDGSIDLTVQKQIAERYITVNHSRSEIVNYLDMLLEKDIKL
jgi:type I restriction-modification system DNA methylase subunit